MQQQLNKIPPWASQVVSRIERRLKGITYSVILEEAIDNGRSCVVWEKEVLFGTSESRHAGCYAFQEASKEQDLLATKYSSLLDNLSGAYGGIRIEEYRYD